MRHCTHCDQDVEDAEWVTKIGRCRSCLRDYKRVWSQNWRAEQRAYWAERQKTYTGSWMVEPDSTTEGDEE